LRQNSVKNQIIALADRLRSSYWFIPAVMSLAAFVLSIAATSLDGIIDTESTELFGWLYDNSPEGARAVLSTITGSMITVTGLVFSLTVVVMSLAAQQYGPLVLSNFMRDRGNQFVLGTFTATFIYSLLVLRTIRDVEDSTFVPHVSGLIGVALAIFSMMVLIYFIHHISQSIQPHTITAQISDELLKALDTLFPEELGIGANQQDVQEPQQDMPDDFEAQSQPILATSTGYLQLVDDDELMGLVTEHDLIVELKYRPGHFAVEGSELGRIWPGDRVDEEFLNRVNRALIFDVQRTPTQDMEFLVDQLVEIAVRALSPGINDPFTAIMAVDRLGETLCRLAQRHIPSTFRYDTGGQLRVMTSAISFEHILSQAFDPIRHYGGGDIRIILHLLKTIRIVGECAVKDADRAALRSCAELIRREGREHLTAESDRAQIEQAFQHAIRNLG
jgi:uncharacterized membrane protein